MTYPTHVNDLQLNHNRLFYAEDLHLRILLNDLYFYLTTDSDDAAQFFNGVRSVIIDRIGKTYLPTLDCLLDCAKEVLVNPDTWIHNYYKFWAHLEHLDEMLAMHQYFSNGDHHTTYLANFEAEMDGD